MNSILNLSRRSAASLAVLHLAANTTSPDERCRSRAQSSKPRRMVNVRNVDTVVVGAGTAGLVTAYFLAKWMLDHNLPGKVLLLDRGVSFSPEDGPSNKISRWYDNWCEFGEIHESIQDGGPYPVAPSDHKGLGGNRNDFYCSSLMLSLKR